MIFWVNETFQKQRSLSKDNILTSCFSPSPSPSAPLFQVLLLRYLSFLHLWWWSFFPLLLSYFILPKGSVLPFISWHFTSADGNDTNGMWLWLYYRNAICPAQASLQIILQERNKPWGQVQELQMKKMAGGGTDELSKEKERAKREKQVRAYTSVSKTRLKEFNWQWAAFDVQVTGRGF